MRYGRGHLPSREWVHNGASIDRETVVWAREMGQAETCRLIAYFKERSAWLLSIEDDRAEPVLRPYPRERCPGE
ncbi:MAG TPA: hypothetical protein VNN77_08305 [candidate division Zixibacteria bacterium]|nr:hypothetical protein [candidate division Zixibacteria bacterium]